MVPSTESRVMIISTVQVDCLTGPHRSSVSATFSILKTSAATQIMPTTCFPRSSGRSEPVIALTARVSKLALHSGKTLHPSRILTNNSKSSSTKQIEESFPVSTNKYNINDFKKYTCHANSYNLYKNIRNKTCNLIEFPGCQKQKNARIMKNPNTNQLTQTNRPINNCSCTQLLHPDWRRVPWKPHFGWTAAHQQLHNRLKAQVKNGELVNIYYIAEDHTECHAPRLSGPSVTSVSEVLEIIRNLNYTKRFRLPLRQNLSTRNLDQYDADDEGYV